MDCASGCGCGCGGGDLGCSSCGGAGRRGSLIIPLGAVSVDLHGCGVVQGCEMPSSCWRWQVLPAEAAGSSLWLRWQWGLGLWWLGSLWLRWWLRCWGRGFSGFGGGLWCICWFGFWGSPGSSSWCGRWRCGGLWWPYGFPCWWWLLLCCIPGCLPVAGFCLLHIHPLLEYTVCSPSFFLLSPPL